MKTTIELYSEAVSNVPEDVRLETGWSFAISDKIADALEKKGMTQKMFAKQIGKTETEVSRWLSGTHNFTLRTIAKISSVLGMNIITV
jgi:ribosome-binding protein aMBF1 (putative translation factor)